MAGRAGNLISFHDRREGWTERFCESEQSPMERSIGARPAAATDINDLRRVTGRPDSAASDFMLPRDRRQIRGSQIVGRVGERPLHKQESLQTANRPRTKKGRDGRKDNGNEL